MTMNEEILEVIKKRAEEKHNPTELRDLVKCEAYTSGQLEGIEMMLKFMELTKRDFISKHLTGGQSVWEDYSGYYTTIELLTKYLTK